MPKEIETQPSLSDTQVFEHILKMGREKGDVDGSVVACVVRDGKILVAATSISAGVVIHAEHNALGYMEQKGLKVLPTDILFTTLEPCTGRFDPACGIPDCTSIIVASGIKNVVYGASDPIQTELTHMRSKYYGINLKQIDNPEIVEKCRSLFNSFSEEFGGYKI